MNTKLPDGGETAAGGEFDYAGISATPSDELRVIT